jgi:hypothetical protein
MATVHALGGAGAVGSVAVGSRRRASSVLAVAFTLSVVLASCTGSEAPPEVSSAPPDPRVTGTLLVRSGFGGTFQLVELPDGDVTPLRMPDYFRTLSGFFDDDGSVIALLQLRDGVRLYRLSADDPPVALGPPLRGGDTMSHAGRSVLVAACGTPPFQRVLDLDAPSAWREVDAGCGAALSPDATSMVWSPDGTTLVQAPVDGSSVPMELADVAELQIPRGYERAPGFAPPIAWSDQGRATALTTLDGWQGVAVGDPPLAVPLGDRGAGPLQVYLDWQPGGSLRAVGSSTTLGGAVRVLGDGEPRVIALFGEPATGTVWSPDGSVVLAASNGAWAVVTPEGEWIWSRIVGRGEEPLDWWAAQ